MNIGISKKTFVEAGESWSADNTLAMGAALAYYAVFSIPPLLIIALGITGYFFRVEGAGYIQAQLSELIGNDGAALITRSLNSVNESEHGFAATLIGVVVLFIGASGVFVQLQDSMNRIWGVAAKPGHFVRDFLKQRLASFGIVLGVSFLLLISLLVSATLAALSAYFAHLLPAAGFLWGALNVILSFGVATLLFASTFKFIPDVRIAWNDVWVGALVTAVLFTLGKSVIGIYLGRSGIGSAYGAAGSILVILAWVYYTSQILYFGAEFTKVYSRGHRVGMTSVEGAEVLS